MKLLLFISDLKSNNLLFFRNEKIIFAPRFGKNKMAR